MFSFNLSGAVDELARQEPVIGLFLMAVGLMFMLMGLRLNRIAIGLSYAVVGFLAGASLPSLGDTARIVLGLAVGLGLGLASLWANRLAVAVLSGLWAALVGILLADKMNTEAVVALVAGGLMFAAGASIAVVLFQETIALVTSVEGTLLFVGGMIILANQSSTLSSHLRGLLVTNPIFCPFLLIAGTMIGFYMQLAELQKKQTGRSA